MEGAETRAIGNRFAGLQEQGRADNFWKRPNIRRFKRWAPHHIKDSQVCPKFPEKKLLAKVHDLYGKEMEGSLSDLLEKIQSIANQHEHLLVSKSVKTWLDKVNKFLEDPLEKRAALKDLIDVGRDVHTCSLLAIAEYENENANCVTEKGPNTSVEMNVQVDCFFLMEESIKKINNVKLEGREYSALRSMAVYAEKYKQCWINDFGQELKSRLEEARAVAAWLVTVLKMAHDLCVEQYLLMPRGGAFLEVVDDFRRYTQMMNSLLRGVIPFKNNAGLDLILHLQRKVESDCKFLKSTIVMVFKDSLKCLSIDRAVPWADLGNPRKSTFVDDAISEAFLEKMPVLLKKLGPKDSLRASQLQHPECSHIARFIGHSENENAKFLILEHMEEDWSTLDSKKLSFSFAEGINIMIQVAKAMRHLHEHHKNQSLGGWLHPQTIFFRWQKNGYYLVKIADAAYEQDSLPNEDDVSRFTILWRLFDDQQRLLPKKLHELYDSCSAPDPSQRPSFQNICDQLWIVLEEVLTGSSCNLKLENSIGIGPKKSLKLAKGFQDSKAISQTKLLRDFLQYLAHHFNGNIIITTLLFYRRAKMSKDYSVIGNATGGKEPEQRRRDIIPVAKLSDNNEDFWNLHMQSDSNEITPFKEVPTMQTFDNFWSLHQLEGTSSISKGQRNTKLKSNFHPISSLSPRA